jgi:hypothetical protein
MGMLSLYLAPFPWGAWENPMKSPRLHFFWRRMTPVSSLVLSYSLTGAERTVNTVTAYPVQQVQLLTFRNNCGFPSREKSGDSITTVRFVGYRVPTGEMEGQHTYCSNSGRHVSRPLISPRISPIRQQPTVADRCR